MESYRKTLTNRAKDINDLYDMYPVLKRIDQNNNKVINTQAIFKTVYSNEYVSGEEATCQGVLFVIKGTIKNTKN